MNREDRRKLGIDRETARKYDQLKSPATVLECAQIAQSAAEDAVSNYHQNINPIIVSLSIQIEVLKSMLIESGAISAEKFEADFNTRVDEYNKMKEETLNKMKEAASQGNDPQGIIEDTEAEDDAPTADVKTNVKPMPVQVEVHKKGEEEG